MTTDDDKRPFLTLPGRPAVREVKRPSADAALALSADQATIDTAEEMRKLAIEAHQKAIGMRSAARQDAMIVVARARERRGEPNSNWTAADADAAHLIADLLIKLQGQEPAPLDPAFAQRDEALAEAAKAASKIEEAMKRDDTDPPPSAA